ncbi:MAG: prolyl oligopeptidase family serine peptidase [Opitutaceae bacterium]
MTSVVSAAPVTWNYPAAERGSVVDNYHGTSVADPYRWLEELDSPSTQSWVAAQNKITDSLLTRLPWRAKLKARLTELWNYPRIGLPNKVGGRVFYSRNSGLQNQAVFYVQEAKATEPRVLIDPNMLAADGTVALTTTAVSRDGKWVAYGTAAAGSDWNEFRVRSVETGKDIEDVIKWVKFSSIAWTNDHAGFFYSRYPAPQIVEGTAKTFSKLEHQQLYYHRLGTSQERDVLIHAVPDQPQWFVGGGTTEDGRWLEISIRRGSSSENLLRVIDLGDPRAPKLDAPVLTLADKFEAKFDVIGSDGAHLFVLTNLDAPRNRLIKIDTKAPARSNWQTLIPESKDVIESVDLIGGKFVVRVMRDASSRLLVYARDGRALGGIDLPGIGTVAGVSGRDEETELFYSFSSFTTPTTNYRYDLKAAQGGVFQAPQVAFDPAKYETKQIFYASKDGTKIPMFITHKKGLKLDGTAPTLLYAYGGFNISLTPTFSVANLAWLEQGGIYALPNLRGGGEYGKDWHQAGTKERKQNVFDDYIAAAEWLTANHYTAPAHLVLSGGSNGGLLVAAVINQRPDLCRVAWPAVGVMDMLRFHKFTVGFAWTSDYGSSDTPEGFRYLSAYSPLHTVKNGGRYPAVLVTTADHDDRVHPGHSFKYTAAMQAGVAPDAGPVLVRIETKAGHGAGKPTTKIIDEAADKIAFALHFLGLDPK